MPLPDAVTGRLALGAAVGAVGAAFLLVTGVSPLSTLGLVLVVGVQGWAGGYWWLRLRGAHASAVELVGMGLALGTVASVISGLGVLVVFGFSLGWVLPAVVAAAHWLVRGRRRVRSKDASSERKPASPVADCGVLWAVVLTLTLGTASLIPNVRAYPLTWTGEWGGYHGDMLFFEAVATSMARLGPLDSIFSPDALIRYHWLTYAWAGQVTEAVGAAPFVVLTRVLPFVAVIASCLIAVAWARRLSEVSWAPAFAVVLLVTGGYVGATYGAIFNFDSPSQSMTTLWLLAFAVVLLSLLRSGRISVGVVAALGLTSFGLAGGKISAGAVAVGAALWVALIAVIRRAEWRRAALVSTAVILVAFAGGYALVVMGSADPGGLKLFNLLDRASSIQGMNPIPGSWGIALGTLALVIAIVARWSGLVWFVLRRDTRWRPETVLGVGLALAAVFTVFALSGGMNDTWFALAASAPLSVISAAGAAEAWRSFGPARRVTMGWALVASLALVVLVALLWLTGPSGGTVWVSSWRWLAPLVGVGGAVLVGVVLGVRFGSVRGWGAVAGTVLMLALVAAPGRALGLGSGQMGVQPGLGEETFTPIQRFVDGIDGGYVREWSDQHVVTALYLRDAAQPGDLVATNVTYSPLVPALTGLQTLVSGMAYQAPYGTASGLDMLVQREESSWDFIDDPSQVSAAALCEAGVEWLWVDPERTQTRTWIPHATVVLESADAIVLRLETSRCS